MTRSATAPIEPTLARAVRAPRGIVRSLIESCKPGIVRLVTITSMVGFALAGSGHTWGGLTLAWTAVVCAAGTALSAAGANALNQWWERRRDALMTRTATRPLPEGRLAPRAVLWFGLALSVGGVGLLLALPTPAPALVAAACVLIYVVAYTPLKPHTHWATYIGAIPGALPPLIGWTAASTRPGLASLAEQGGLSLFIIMMVWQIPHFLAIAWMYRDDYAKGGFCVLPVIDTNMQRTSRSIALWTAMLVPATVFPAWAMPDRLGMGYVTIALLTALGFAALAAKLLRTRERRDARRLFFASIIHLPVLFVAMVAEALIRVAVQ